MKNIFVDVMYSDSMPLHSLLKEPLLVGAVGAGLERGRRRPVVRLVHRLNALLAHHVVQGAVLKV